MSVLTTEQLSVSLGSGHRQRQILRDVSVTIEPGEILGILGPNGAGKSTLIRAALGLVPATAGQLCLHGQPISELSQIQRAQLVAYVPQDREVAWSLTVEAVTALGRLPHRSTFAAMTDADRSAIRRAMIDADVYELRDRPITELSGGERARALIARALAQEAPLILADEPTSGLDPAHQLTLLSLLRKKADAGQSVALSIHELHLAARWCDRLILLHEGRIVAEGQPSEVLTEVNMRDVYGCEVHVVTTPDGDTIIIPHLPATTTPRPGALRS